MKSQWRLVVEYFNKRKGKVVLRKNYLKWAKNNNINEALAETYRSYWSRAEFLEHVKPGHYLVKRSILASTSINNVVSVGKMKAKQKRMNSRRLQ